MRHKAITFQDSSVRSSLEGLKWTKWANWQQNDVDYIVALYETSENRYQRVFDNIDKMERKIEDRNLKERIQQKRTNI